MSVEIRQDSIFLMGKDHKVCQDYAKTFKIPYAEDKFAYVAIVADGCSGAKDSDVGARILTLTVPRVLKLGLLHDTTLETAARVKTLYYHLGERVIEMARETAQNLHLSVDCLQATLLISLCIADRVVVFAYGDGCLLIEYENGDRQFAEIEFSSGAPYYLANWNSESRRARYREQYGNGTMTRKNWLVWDSTVTGYADDYSESIQTYDDAVIFRVGSVDVIKSIVISSDGLSSLTDHNGSPKSLPSHEAFKEILAFRNTVGEYLQRRVISQDKRWADAKIFHGDDLGMAAQAFIKSEGATNG